MVHQSDSGKRLSLGNSDNFIRVRKNDSDQSTRHFWWSQDPIHKRKIIFRPGLNPYPDQAGEELIQGSTQQSGAGARDPC